MACAHNQAIINGLLSQINIKNQQIENLKITEENTRSIMGKHEEFGNELSCVIDNLEGNYIEAGSSYDRGTMTECYNDAQRTIADCENIIELSENKRNSLQSEIDALNSQILGLQGDCATCVAARIR